MAPQLQLTGRITHDGDVSGIAKVGPVGILVSDEGSDVQILNFENGSASVVSRVPLLGAGDEADFEAVASGSDGWFFVSGSHGVTKKGGRGARSRETVFRFKVGSDNRLVDVSESTLTPLLKKIPVLAPAVGRSLQDEGLNVEGLASVGDTLYFGLRTPSAKGGVFVVSTSATDLFSEQPGPSSLHAIPVGSNLGIRALEPVADGRILVLLGGKRKSGLLALWDPEHPSRPLVPALLPKANKEGKAEALLLLGETPGSATFAVLYDSLPRGAPRTFRIAFDPK